MVALAHVAGLYRSPLARILFLVLVTASLVGLFFSGGGRINDIPFVKDIIHPSESVNVQVQVEQVGKVIALVFYGRREFVSVLACYLRRNLKENGGLLDEVIFSINTDNQEDLAYLDELVQTNRKFIKFKSTKEYTHGTYGGNWEPVQAGNIYIKIDDDVLFFEDDAIAHMVKRLNENPKLFAVSANVVNNPALSWVHYSMGVYQAYFPEMEAPNPPPGVSWRASELPPWQGPEDFQFDGSHPAPYPNHRWLPVPGDYDITKTPAKDLSYDWDKGGLFSWAAAAQTHYSFLHHLEKQDTHRYKFDIWDYHYYRISINFYGVRGSDIVDSYPFPGDDEHYLTVERPKELGRHVIVEGNALAVHFAFGPQRDAHERHGLFDTDLVSRYKAYADELVCPFSNRTAIRADKLNWR